MNTGLHRRTDLALSVLHALAGSGDTVSGADLAKECGTTPSFLPQVVAPLVRAGWVTSTRGPGGGYRLTPSARQARLLEVIETVQGPVADGRCALRDAPCPGEGACPVHIVWSGARRLLIEGLAATPAVQV